jgi:hypothetical protein
MKQLAGISPSTTPRASGGINAVTPFGTGQTMETQENMLKSSIKTGTGATKVGAPISGAKDTERD